VVDSRIDELRRRLERDPGSRLFAQLAEEYRKAGNHAEAIRVARSGLEHHPSYPSARLTLGRALLESGDPGGARSELETVLREAPDNILASRFLGQALESQGDFRAALQRYEATLKMAPGDRQLELQIRSVHKRLEAPPAAAGSPRREAPVTLPRRDEEAPPSEEDGALPPTIRIHPSGDRGGGRAPQPPPLPAATLPRARDTAASAAPAPGPPPPAVSQAEAEPGTEPPPLSAEPFYESDVAPTLPTTQAPELEPAGPVDRPSQVEVGAATNRVPVKPAEPVEVEGTTLPAAPPRPAPPIDTPAAAPGEEAAVDEAAPPGEPTPFSSSTLAELYLRQGLVDRSVEVYRQLLAAEPDNERARARLAEILGSAGAVAAEPLAPGQEETRAARRRALERTIGRLEALLSVVRRR
jgi:tetratricopeptide (TPR) repeat protein